MNRLTIYPARDGWRWRLVAKNNRIVADSGEAYETASNAKRLAGREDFLKNESALGSLRSSPPSHPVPL